MQKKQFRTTELIVYNKEPLDDLNFITKHKLKPTNLLRAKIKELRAKEDGLICLSQEELTKRFKFLQDKLLEVSDFVMKKGLWDEFKKKSL